MPDKGLSVATYAAGASLATIALVYVFAPTYFIDSAPPSSSGNPLAALTGRKTGVVGLANAANDCFINSVLQALAGLGDLRIYLIRETHRRKIDDAGVYSNAVPHDAEDSGSDGNGSGVPGGRPMPVWKVQGLQAGLVSKGLKDMIDHLNERPIYKKVITAGPFVRVLEIAFQQRISRQQQDAQEFLQVVAERLCDEYHAGRRARRYAKRQADREVSAGAAGVTGVAGPSVALNGNAVNEKLASIAAASNGDGQDSPSSDEVATSNALGVGSDFGSEEEGFPMEGKIESQIECLTCGFKPRPSEQTFCTLTLNVPQASHTTLSACFDSMLKTEYIDEFKCEKCRLVHAKQTYELELNKSKSESQRNELAHAIQKLQQAIDTDPERKPPDVALPDARHAPKRRIARHFRLVNFPKVLAIHLSRSIYDASNQSQKNSAKVSFPERLPLGSILNQRKYKLISVVMHKGSHHSGHYESFRRQTIAPPYSNPNTFQQSHIYSPSSSPAATTPKIGSSDASLGISPSSSRLADSPISSTAELPPSATSTSVDTNSSGSSPAQESLNLLPPKTNAAIGRSSRSSSLRGRSSSSAAMQPGPTSAPRDPTKEDDGNDTTGETASLRSITRSTLSRITSSSRSGSRAGSRSGSQNRGLGGRLSLRPGSKDSATASGVVSNGAPDKDKSKAPAASTHIPQPRHKKKKAPDRWWRISDEKVREASTKEVLGMQREVYLLFYELERDPYMG
ncbi:hypothetical protein Sste5346_003728 [Sporothrix stenoceras]|uniref:Ubiquitin carboxyl-terminal hydrolase n=1 Tax=Sporothrix stenoceras TaxID=5173 RepID=A0ABR3ZB35_9PEZI